MAKALSARAVEALKADGVHGVGDGLYLQIKGGSRTWLFRFQMQGRRREMGLGPYPTVPLKEAHVAVADARKLIAGGIDPIAARKAGAVKIPTFGEFADDLLSSLEAGFRNEKHRAQWAVTLGKVEYNPDKVRIAPKAHETHVAALRVLRAKPVNEVATEDVLAVLKPIWSEASETASRVRGRIEKILDGAKAKGFRTGENPAAWRGHLANLLPKRQKLQRGHHAALPFDDVPGFVGELRDRTAVAARALEFCILTAARSGEVFGATWAEIDTDAKLWTVPAVRMKAGRDHRVPLTNRALTILGEMEKLRRASEPEEYVFPGQRPGRPLSGMAFSMVLRRMGRSEITAHGFRSSFRDWCGECTPFPREVAEAALAHVVGDQTERAYRRGDALDKRRALMEAWGVFIEPKAANVVPLCAKQ